LGKTRATCKTPDQLIFEEVLTIWPFDTNSHTLQGRVFVSNGQIGERHQKATSGSFASGSKEILFEEFYMKKAFYFSIPLFLTASLFAEEAAPQGRQQSMWQTLMMIGIALLFFYLILWRPEQKRRKKMNQLRSGMGKGDRVTAMGIIGTVVRIDEATVILKMVDGAKIEVLKNAISEVQPASEQRSTASPAAGTNGTE